jgi:RsiW-degrading membrane proteinase PrsW (M82 family)
MRNRKQLYVLLAAAVWVSFVFLRFYGDYRPGDPTIGVTVGALVFGAIAFSLPALFLAVILFWWFGKDKQH